MTILKPGDRIDCCVKAHIIVSPYNSEYDEVKTFEIVSLDSEGYFIYVPHYFILSNSILLDNKLQKQFKINKKFLNEQVSYIKAHLIYKISYIMDGKFCSRCGEFCHQASSNQENNGFICWACRFDPFR